ncbi:MULTISPECIES: hypothetical protein [unclassified Streptomyces]|uniref:hypothetical protein n=1 Tax=unclassified Streptomyces TaxID=2593676 RepID=UPI0007C6BC6E|nr:MULTISPECIES: hypothetical protein [unclassified Streptomyces]THC52357.1 hypothetical protein E7X58_10060 [Streptomyces sp. A1499]
MFEIRVITEPADADRVTAALSAAFETGETRQYLTRDGQRTRLYVTADHRPDPEPYPAPEAAYALAPSILSEMRWVTNTLATAECFTALERDYYLRKATLLDRIALMDEPAAPFGDARTAAEAAAVFLLDTDRDHLAGHVVERADRDPRGYVRQQYALRVGCVCDDLGEGPCYLHPDPEH